MKKKLKIKFSFIIPARNSECTIKRTLDSIQSQSEKNFETIVVVNGSNDSTLSIARSFSEVNTIISKKVGRGAARNEGARRAKGEFLLFVDSDVSLGKDWLKHISRYIDQYPMDAVATSITPVSSENGTTLDQFRYEYLKWRSAGTFLSNMGPMGEALPLIATAACAIRKSAFTTLQGFDETLIRNEDADFSLRLFLNGYLIGSTKLAKAFDSFDSQRAHTRFSRYLFRTFQARYHHFRPASIGDISSRHFFSAMTSQKDNNPLLLFALLNQLSFNFGAAANFFLNKNPLRLKKIEASTFRSNKIYFNFEQSRYSLRNDVRLMQIDDAFYYCFPKFQSVKCSAKERKAILSLLQQKPIRKEALARLILSGQFIEEK